MKRIVYIVAAGLLCIACTQKELTGEGAGTKMSFGFRDGWQTRGEIITDDAGANPLLTMGVYCSYNGTTQFDPRKDAPGYMTNTRIGRPGKTTAWDYENASDIRYWANEGYHSFFAYAPYASAVNGISVNGDGSTAGVPTLTYTVPTTCAGQPDLMVAMPVLNQTKAASGAAPVTFLMKHALTCIGFSVRGSGETITSIRVKGILVTGTLAMDGSAIRWTDLGAPATSEYEIGLIPGATAPAGNDYTRVTAGDGYLMMIPQTLQPGAELIVETDVGVHFFDLTPAAAAWTPGQRINYNVSLEPPAVITVTPAFLFFPATATGAGVGDIEVSTSTGTTGDWTLTSGDTWFRLSTNPAATFATATATVSGTGSARVYSFTQDNTAATRRTATITGTQSISVIQYGTTDESPAQVPNNYSYAGAFWRADQMGERVIRIPVTAAAQAGAWTATIFYMDNRWNPGDIVLDNLMFPGNPYAGALPPADNSWIATTSATSAGGEATNASIGPAMTGSSFIYFRIGLKTTYAFTAAAPARYAVIHLSYNNHTKA